MKTTLRTFTMALLAVVFTAASFISLHANDDVKDTKNFPAIYSQPSDSDKNEGDSGSGGPVIPPQPGK